MGVLFDYNETPLGSTFLLWVAWALALRGTLAVAATALLACTCKENAGLYVATLAAGLCVLRLTSWKRATAVATMALSLFAFEIWGLFPMFREGGFRHWEFEDLGATPAEIAGSALTRPDRALTLLVDDPQKRRSLLLPLLTTGYIGLAEPTSLVLLLPNWGERFLSTHRTRWWGYYYGMPAAAMATLGLLAGWRRLKAAGTASRHLPGYVLALCAPGGPRPALRDAQRQPPERSLLLATTQRLLARGHSYPGSARALRPCPIRGSRWPRSTTSCPTSRSGRSS